MIKMTDKEVQVGFCYKKGIGIKVVIKRFLYEKANEIRYRVLYIHPSRINPGRYMSPRRGRDIKKEAKKGEKINESELSKIEKIVKEYDPTLELTLTTEL